MSDTEDRRRDHPADDAADASEPKRPKLELDEAPASASTESKPNDEDSKDSSKPSEEAPKSEDASADSNESKDQQPASDAAAGAETGDAEMKDAPPDDDKEESPLEKARRAADAARVKMLPDLDPPTPPAPHTGLPKHQHKYALSAIRAIKRLKDAIPFLGPVDPVKQGVPQYFDYIKTPMDLGTIEKKLVANEYDTVKEIVDDFSQLVWNCIYFNGEDALISKMALAIAQSFTKQLSNMPTWDDLTKKASSTASTTTTSAPAATKTASLEKHVASATPPAVDADKSRGNGAGETSAIASDDAHHVHHASDVKRATRTGTGSGTGTVPLRRKSMADGRPKREIRPPRPRDLTYETRPRNKKFAAELKFAGQILKEFQSRKLEAISFPFLLPVDPVEQGVPQYFEIIKEPMDLSTMQRKLNEGHYYNADEFEADMRLMFRNCYTFNPEGAPVNVLGHKLEDEFDRRWVDKPQPAPTPPPIEEMSDVESDYDEEYEDAGISNPAISVLEAQLKSMRRELTRLKREALEEWRSRGKRKRQHGGAHGGAHGGGAHHQPGHARRTSTVPRLNSKEPMTFEQKQELSKKIETLPEKKLRTVIAIIQESMPALRNSGQDEIELDMDQLEPKTLRKLYNFVVLQRREPATHGAASANGGTHQSSAANSASPGANAHQGSVAGSDGFDGSVGNGGGLGGSGDEAGGVGAGVHKKRKSKPLSEEEHTRQIESIQHKMQQFKQFAGGSGSGDSAAGSTGAKAPGSEQPAAGAADSSSDEGERGVGFAQSSDDDSSSEEE